MDSRNDYLIKRLVENVPEFIGFIVPEYENSAYMIFSDFGLFLRDSILAEANSELVNRCFLFITELLNASDVKTVEMIKVTTLEALTDSLKTIEVSREKLTGNAADIFADVMAYLRKGHP